MSEDNKEIGYVAFCTECKTTISDAAAERDTHLAAGHPSVCGLCGGVVAISRSDKLEQAKHRADSRRGLG